MLVQGDLTKAGATRRVAPTFPRRTVIKSQVLRMRQISRRVGRLP